ncbi:MAG: DUF4261 domain-containing protein [Thermogutta sp.]|nr:DUF4261 domain-containing protein [Thermogutta sp.]HQF13073.1 DUF4261 domain-containing protein [Thermogutta sp.]
MKSDVFFAIVLLKDPKSVSVPKMAEFVRTHWADAPSLTELDADPVVSPEGSLLMPFMVNGEPAFLVVEDKPVPEEDLELAILTAWYWPEASQAAEEHRAFAMVVLPSAPADPLEKTAIVTQLTAALAMTSQAVAVFWAKSNLIHEPEAFFNSAKHLGSGVYPIELWVGFHAEPEPDHTITFFTRGMLNFGLPEIEVYNSTRDLQFIYERVFNVAHFLFEHGPVIKDQETVGTNEDEQFVVTIGPSRFDARIKTMQIDM